MCVVGTNITSKIGAHLQTRNKFKSFIIRDGSSQKKQNATKIT